MTRTAAICLTLWLLSSTAFAQDWDYQESRNAINGQLGYAAIQGFKYTTHDGRTGAAIILMMCDCDLLRVGIVASDVFKTGKLPVTFRVGQTPPIETTMLAEKATDGTSFSTNSASVFDNLKLLLSKGGVLHISIDNDVTIEFRTGDSQAVTKVAAKCGH